MWKQIFDLLAGVVFLTRDLTEVQRQVKELRAEMDDVHKLLNSVVHDMEALSERERLEREKLMLRLENVLLREREQRTPERKRGRQLPGK